MAPWAPQFSSAKSEVPQLRDSVAFRFRHSCVPPASGLLHREGSVSQHRIWWCLEGKGVTSVFLRLGLRKPVCPDENVSLCVLMKIVKSKS